MLFPANFYFSLHHLFIYSLESSPNKILTFKHYDNHMNNVEKSGINVVLGVVDNCQGEASFCISCLEHLGGCHQVLYILSQNLKVRLIRNIFHNFQYLPDFLTVVSYFLPSHYQPCC